MSELLEYTFFRHALVGALLVSVLCGMVGTYVVTRRQVFVGGGIAHASLGGVGMGAFFGFSPLLGASLFALGSGYAIRWLSRRREIREDSAIAMLWTFGMSAGILCSYLSSDFMPELPSFLFGNILTVTSTDLYLLGGLTFFTACCFTMLQRPIAMVAFDYEFARSQRIPASAIELLMIGLSAHGRHCTGYIHAVCTPAYSQPFHTKLQTAHSLFHRLRICRMYGRFDYCLPL
jgi:zinc transport system permease protein